MVIQELHTVRHCAFSLRFHLVLAPKERRKAITKERLERLRVIFGETIENWRCEPIEFNGETDHAFGRDAVDKVKVKVNAAKAATLFILDNRFIISPISLVYGFKARIGFMPNLLLSIPEVKAVLPEVGRSRPRHAHRSATPLTSRRKMPGDDSEVFKWPANIYQKTFKAFSNV